MSGDHRDRGAERRRVLRALDGGGSATDPDSELDRGDRDVASTVSADGGAERPVPDSNLDAERGHDSQPARALHAPAWQCAGCGRSFPDRPDSCPECGTDRFGRVEGP